MKSNNLGEYKCAQYAQRILRMTANKHITFVWICEIKHVNTHAIAHKCLLISE